MSEEQREAQGDIPEEEEIRLVAVGNALLKRWRAIFWFPIGVAAGVAIYSLMLPLSFQATVTFVPESQPAGVRLPGAGGPGPGARKQQDEQRAEAEVHRRAL